MSESDDNWGAHDEAVSDCEHDWRIESLTITDGDYYYGSYVARCINCSVTASPEVINDYMAEGDVEYIKLCVEKDKWNRRQYSWRKWGRRRLYEIKVLRAKLDNAHLSIEILEESAKVTEEILAHKISALKAELAQRDAKIAFLEELCSKLDARCGELWDHILPLEEELAELESRNCDNCYHNPCGCYWLEYCSDWKTKEVKDE